MASHKWHIGGDVDFVEEFECTQGLDWRGMGTVLSHSVSLSTSNSTNNDMLRDGIP